MNKRTIRLTESELKGIIMESIKRILKEGQNDTPSNTHYAIHKPTNKIVFSWDYSGYDPEDLKLYKNDYFIADLKDMEMNPKEITIWTRKSCMNKGIDPTDDANWSNYPMNEAQYYGKYDTTFEKRIQIHLSEITFETELEDYVAENFDELPSDEVTVDITFSASAYDSGSYDMPPSGGDVKATEIVVDPDKVFEQALPDGYYQEFINVIETHVRKYMDYYMDDVYED